MLDATSVLMCILHHPLYNVIILVTPPGRGDEYCDQPVCLCVCLSVCLRAYLWNRWTDPLDILYADTPWPWLRPPPAAWRYVMYFRFYG